MRELKSSSWDIGTSKSMQWYAAERIMSSIGGIQADITETDHR